VEAVRVLWLYDDVVDLRSVFGVEARVTMPSAATGGAYVEMECTVEPGSGSMIHYHPDQEKTYRVLEGTLEVFRERTWRPALAFQAHLETLDRLVRSGKVRGTNDPRSLIYMSMSAVKHQPDVAVKPPQVVVNFMAWLGRRLRFTLD